jgi:glyoxylase-like metal-dependent hydrolase (beta-lactamase superfamily II)
MTAGSAPARVERPPNGGATEVAPGVFWVRMRLPFALDHVNLWLLEDGDRWTLVDTGHGDDATRAAWEALAPSLLRGRPIRRVIATHHHPDHVGLSGWMAKRWGAELWCTRTEWLMARALSLRPLGETRVATRAYYWRAGVPKAGLAPLVDCVRSYPDAVSAPPRFRRIADGQELVVGQTRWRVVVGGGHAPEHACLHAPERGLLLSGDQVLPHISPNVSVWPSEPEEDPLADFLRSLEALRTLPADTLVLPAHGRPFAGLRERCEALAGHHRERLDAVLAACARPRTVFDVVGVLFDRALDPHQTTFAVGEALAHLNHLAAHGRVRRERRSDRPDRWVRLVRDAAAPADSA